LFAAVIGATRLQPELPPADRKYRALGGALKCIIKRRGEIR
jgi:hypothetical protein